MVIYVIDYTAKWLLNFVLYSILSIYCVTSCIKTVFLLFVVIFSSPTRGRVESLEFLSMGYISFYMLLQYFNPNREIFSFVSLICRFANMPRQRKKNGKNSANYGLLHIILQHCKMQLYRYSLFLYFCFFSSYARSLLVLIEVLKTLRICS